MAREDIACDVDVVRCTLKTGWTVTAIAHSVFVYNIVTIFIKFSVSDTVMSMSIGSEKNCYSLYLEHATNENECK